VHRISRLARRGPRCDPLRGWTPPPEFFHPDPPDDDGGAGVREPRTPRPGLPAASVAAELPELRFIDLS
jgi:hypothetical protein